MAYRAAGSCRSLGPGWMAVQRSRDAHLENRQSSRKSRGVPTPSTTFTEPTRKLSGDLKILMWSHFVPAADQWFDPFVQEWGKQVGVNVTVDHINQAEIPARTAAEIQAKQGHDLIQYIATFSQFEPSVVDLKDVVQEAEKRHGKMLDVVRKSSFNPNTNKYYAYSPAWAPDPGDYRKSMWEKVGLPNGPTTWDELLRGGAEIKKSQGVQMGIGMSQEIDSNMAGRALLWSFGGSIQDENEKVVINSPETVAAVEFMTRLYKESMTPEVFSWNAASNNQGLGRRSDVVHPQFHFGLAYGTEREPIGGRRHLRQGAAEGPRPRLVAQHVMYNWIVPSFSPNVDAAKEFLLHYTANLPSVTYQSKLYDFPAFPDAVPDLDGWLDKDPFGANPPDKLAVLKDSTDWCTNIGHPGPASPAISEVLYTFVIPNMYAKAARGELSPQQSVAEAEKQINGIFQNWRSRGLVAG